MATYTMIWNAKTPASQLKTEKDFTGSSFTEISESVSDGQTDFEIVVAIDVSAVQAFELVSDQAVTFETNSGSAPTNTISLVANQPYRFVTGDYASFLLTGDVTSVFITNSSGNTANIEMRILQDATP